MQNIAILKRVAMYLEHWQSKLNEEQIFWVTCQLQNVKGLGFTISPDSWKGYAENTHPYFATDCYKFNFDVYYSYVNRAKMLHFHFTWNNTTNRFFIVLDDNAVSEFENFIICYGE